MNFKPMKDLMERLTAWRIPGNVINIYKDNKLVFEYSSGYSDISKKEKMTPDKYFYMYSCSKIVTTLAAMQLYEKGYFLLDDPLYEYIPEFKNMTIKDPNTNQVKECKNNITIRNIMTMTAGLNYNFNNDAFKRAGIITNGHYDTLATIKCLAKEPLDFEPGEKWQYSLCHDVLAAFVETVSGKKFRNYVQENIFNPLDVTASYVNGDKEKFNLCKQYRFVNGGSTDIVEAQSSAVQKANGIVSEVGPIQPYILGDEYDSGGAGIITSVPDFAKITATLANGGETDNGNKIISKNTIDLWRTNQLNENQLKNFNWPQYKGYGYGLGVRTMMDKAKSGSNGAYKEFGWAGAAGAIALIDVDNNISFFYSHHMLNNQEAYVFQRLRNVFYTCF